MTQLYQMHVVKCSQVNCRREAGHPGPHRVRSQRRREDGVIELTIVEWSDDDCCWDDDTTQVDGRVTSVVGG